VTFTGAAARDVRPLIALMEHDYGRPERGRSQEYVNLYRPLRRLYPRTLHFDHVARARAVGARAMNIEFERLVEHERPDVVIVALFGEEIDPAVLGRARAITRTVGYFFDETWRRSYARRWSRHFDVVTAQQRAGAEMLRSVGAGRVLHVPSAFDETVYRPLGLPPQRDLAFVGLYHPYREWMLARFRRAGLEVEVFGHGWPTGRISLEEMVSVFNTTRVNLNISNSSHWDPRYLISHWRALPTNIRLAKDREQVKARHFEIAGCAAFQISFEAPELDLHFGIGSEIVTYRDIDDAIAKARYYLARDAEREAIAVAAGRRARRDHTASRRMADLVTAALRADGDG
jgi:spore maturation protein CgeB